MKLDSLVKQLERIAPLELASPLDEGKIGLILRGSETIDGIAVALDPTLKVIKQAIDNKADILITHHTLIWTPLTNIPANIHKQLKLALENELSLYVLHTNYDVAQGGINDVLADVLALKDVYGIGIARMGNVEPINTADFANFVSKKLRSRVQYIGDNKIEKVVVVGGSGFGDVIDAAIESGADALVSAELKHSIMRRAEGQISLIDGTHYGTEAPAMKALAERLNAEFIDDPPKLLTL
jgi:dinuclear metal center YbgI/SA1388 family protein